jgi:subfamily B ATP-binding cassette protein MsbA
LDYSARYLLTRLVKEHVRHYTVKLLFAVLCMMAVALTTSANVSMIKPALDKIFFSRDKEMLMLIPGAVMLISFVNGIASYFQNLLMKFVGQRIVTDMQLRLYEHLLHSDIAVLNQESSGKLISRFTNDIVTMRGAVSNLLTGIAKEFLTVIFLIGVMFYQSITLSLITFIVFPLAIFPIIRLGKRMRKIAGKTQEQLGHYTSQLDETFRSIRIVKSYRQEQFEISKARKIVEDIFKLYVKAARTDAIASPIMETISGIAIASVIWYGGLQVINGVTTAGGFMTFIVAFITAYKPVKSLAGLNTNLQEGLSAAKRLFSFLDIKPIIKDKENAFTLKVNDGYIRLDRVSFGYNKSKLALKDLSLDIPAGKTIAIVGRSGGGKSTIVNLLLRFYDPGQGSILIDDQNIADATLASLRDNIAIVTQDVMLFDDTVMANIAYGKQNATEEQIIQAAKAASAHEFIMEMPEGYNTIIGHHGSKLSGGQRQRLSIARAILKDAPILILDEATSSLDPIAEHEIQQALEQLRKNRTTIVIAHRLSTIVNAERIYVMKNGEIAESGTHTELLELGKEYVKLYNTKNI